MTPRPCPRHLSRALTLLLAASLLLVVPSRGAGDEPADAANDVPTRIMLLGDSVTQGSAGDWTWRYRLWRHLRAAGADVDFVGPDRHLADQAGPSYAYADRSFDQDHAAAWGLWAAAGMERVGGLVTTHRPDVVVVMLGINDLLFNAPAESVLWCLQRIVEEARAADPGVDVVLSEVTQTWGTLDGRAEAVNAGLPALAASLTTPESRVSIAHAAAGYRVSHTFDGSHPSAQGEVRIAAAVADALSLLGIGAPYPRPLRTVGNVPRPPVILRARPANRAVRLSWKPPAGATSFFLWRRDATAKHRWHRMAQPVTGTKLRVTGLRNLHRYEFKMKARKGGITVWDVTSPMVSGSPPPLNR